MRRANKLTAVMKTVYFKLTVSFIVLIVISIAMVGAGSYYYFSANFNEQIEKANLRLLNHLSETLHDNVIVQVENLYLDIVTEQFQNRELQLFFDNAMEGNHSVVVGAYEQLKRFVAGRSELIDSIDIYYKYSDIVISSRRGILYLRERGDEAGVEWLRSARAAASQAIWLEPGWGSSEGAGPGAIGGEDERVVTYVRAYPVHAENKGYIAIKVKEAAVSRIIGNRMPTDSAKLFLLGRGGGLIAGSEREWLSARTSDSPFLREIAAAERGQDHRLESIQAEPVIISYRKIESSGWSIVQFTPVSDYYEKSIAIRNTLIVVCMAVILFGAMLSALFARSLYNPLKTIIAKVKPLFGYMGAVPPAPVNEYAFIHYTIDNLSVKVDELASTLSANLPTIKHNFLRKLFHRQLEAPEQLQEYCRLLEVELSGCAYSSAIVELNSRELDRHTLQNNQYIKYDLIRWAEQSEPARSGGLVLAADWDDYRVILLLGLPSGRMEEAVRLSRDIVDHIRDAYRLQATVAVGGVRHDALAVHSSYEEAVVLLKYRYFVPTLNVLYGEALLARETSPEEIGEETLHQFGKLLRSGDQPSVSAFIDGLAGRMEEGSCSAEHGHQRLRDLISVYRQFLFEIRLSSRQVVPADVMLALHTLRDVREFADWLKRVVDATFAYLDRRSGNRGGELAADIQQYIRAHLSAELSLDAVAERFSLSPKYLSRMFKEETGDNFTDFVTNARIDKACDLLLEDMNIEQIAREVGFNSSGYFIRKFKEARGITPGSFKKQPQGTDAGA